MPFDPDRIVALRRVGDAVFKAPVRIGDTIHVEGEVVGTREVDAGHGLVECRWRVLNQRGKLVLRASVELLWRRGAVAQPRASARRLASPPRRSRCCSDDAPRGQAAARHGRAHARLDRVRRGRARTAGGRRDRADRLRSHPADDRARGRAAARAAGRARARRELGSDLAALSNELGSRWDRLDGALHAIAFAPQDALGGNFMDAPAESAEIAFRTSAHSFKALAAAAGPADGRRGRLARGHGLRRLGGVAGLRLDGRGEGRAGVGVALPGARPRALAACASTSCPPGRWTRRPRAASPGSTGWLALGAPGAARLGHRRTPRRSPTRSASCCPIARGRSAARSCTWTAASTRWAPRCGDNPPRCCSPSTSATRRHTSACSETTSCSSTGASPRCASPPPTSWR